MDGDCAVTPWVVELVAAIRDEYEFNAELASGFVEAARLVAEFGGEKEESWHSFLRARRGRHYLDVTAGGRRRFFYFLRDLADGDKLLARWLGAAVPRLAEKWDRC